MEQSTPYNTTIQTSNIDLSKTNPSAPPMDIQIPHSSPNTVPPPSLPSYPPPPYELSCPPGSAYPQPYTAPPTGYPYVPPGYTPPQPGFTSPGYPAPYYPPSQNQQQQQVVVVNGQQFPGSSPVIVAPMPPISMIGAMAYSCIVFWFCFLVFGGIAFILALVGQSSLKANDTQKALSMRNASYAVSSAGMIIGVLIIILCIVFY